MPDSLRPMEYSPPGSSFHGLSQARLLERVAMLSSRGSSQPRDRTHLSCTAGRFFTIISSGEPHTSHHMEREREQFHRGEEEAGRDIVNKVHPRFFIAESLPGKKRSLFSSYWALLLSNSKGWQSISFWSPNSTELRLLFINFFKIMVWKKIKQLCFFLFVVNFVIHWNETAMCLHVFPIPIPPPTSLSTCSL